MRIFGRSIVNPIMIKIHGEPGMWYSEISHYPILIKIGNRAIGLTKSKTSGSTDVYNFRLHIMKMQENRESRRIEVTQIKETSFTWRFDVAWEHFDRESFLKHKKSRALKKA